MKKDRRKNGPTPKQDKSKDPFHMKKTEDKSGRPLGSHLSWPEIEKISKQSEIRHSPATVAKAMKEPRVK